MVMRRPLTRTSRPCTRTSRWTPDRKRRRSPYRPWNVNEKGMVGNPAGPTVAPGGSVVAAAWVAGALDAAVSDAPLDFTAAPVAATAPTPDVGAVVAVEPVALSDRKLTSAP